MSLLACCAATACGDDVHQGHFAPSANRSRITRRQSRRNPFRFFSPSSFWNKRVPTNAPLDPNSASIISALDREIKGPLGINTTSYSVPIYTVPANQPMIRVRLVDPRRAPGGPALQLAWDAVPLPTDAKPAAGTDRQLVVWQPYTNRLWEFWKLNRTKMGWGAEWGGAMDKVSSNLGVYGPEAWPGGHSEWGGSASSLSLAGGLITLEDLKLGRINHALAMAIPNPRAGVYAWPAKRTDGLSRNPRSLPEGAHLRLNPNLDLASMHLPRLTFMLAKAAQRYGIIVRDTAGAVVFFGQDPGPTGTEPYTGAHGYFEGKLPRELLESFPWSHLQLLKMHLRPT